MLFSNLKTNIQVKIQVEGVEIERVWEQISQCDNWQKD